MSFNFCGIRLSIRLGDIGFLRVKGAVRVTVGDAVYKGIKQSFVRGINCPVKVPADDLDILVAEESVIISCCRRFVLSRWGNKFSVFHPGDRRDVKFHFLELLFCVFQFEPLQKLLGFFFIRHGAENITGRIPFDAEFKKMDEAGEKMLQQVTTGFPGFAPEDTLSEKYFENIFAEAIKVAEERNVALYCGEYGVIENVDPEDAVKWYKLINNVFVKYGIGRAAWSYREMNFGISDGRMDKVRDELIKYL